MEDKSVVFRALYVIAWPIWAGGYPTLQEALRTLEDHRGALTSAIANRLHLLFGPTFSLADFHSEIGAHSPVRGLQPRDDVPNSLKIVVVVEAPGSSLLLPSGNLWLVEDAVEQIGRLLLTFSQSHMPHAKEGANLYDITKHWDAGPTSSYTESGEPLRHAAKATMSSGTRAMEPENSLPWPQFFITQVIGSDDLPDVQILTLPGYESKDAVSDLEHLLKVLRSEEIEESQLIVGSGVDHGPHACLAALRQAILDEHHRGNMLSSDPKRIETYAETIYTSNQLPIMNSPLTGSSLLQLVMAGGTSASFMAAFPHDLGHITAYFLLVGGTRIVLGAADGVSIGLKQGLTRVILRWMGIPEGRATTKKRMGRSRNPAN